MDRLTSQQRHAIGSGFAGLLLVVVGFKFMLQWDFNDLKPPLQVGGEPALLFFTLDDPCECMQGLVQQADEQIVHWPEAQRAGISITRLDFDARQDLAGQYDVFRVPCLVLLDSQGEIVYRQDYPLIEGGPFRLIEFETQIHNLASTP